MEDRAKCFRESQHCEERQKRHPKARSRIMVISVGWYTLLRKGALGLGAVLLLCCPAPAAVLKPCIEHTERRPEITDCDSPPRTRRKTHLL
ncbi:hypothetical protein EYF80_004129 [Liparis tanakae]|uniref:Uncharacterized protein n=1 Tax=Liparis tanakae TaxID=230148 RepID=A0A4Z2J5M8_9TELE|nr:hypothetical protein EYF80_004129 [Liparis tanakae]